MARWEMADRPEERTKEGFGIWNLGIVFCFVVYIYLLKTVSKYEPLLGVSAGAGAPGMYFRSNLKCQY